MSDIIENYFDDIFRKYNINLKVFMESYEKPEFDSKLNEIEQEIKAFHICDDKKGYNVFFITSDDKVFGFGSNCFGCCGLGHNSVVNGPQIIPELCHKNIQQFFIGYNFILAQSFENQIYGWGKNNCGQLAKGYICDITENFKPDIIEKNKSFIEISCGSEHTLALCSDGFVYGWGANYYGQIGCGNRKIYNVSKVIRLEKFERNSVNHIYCSFDKSFALTFDRLVYSWGRNDWCSLGHDLNRDEYVFKPRLINISNIKSISMSRDRTHFLTNERTLYFCGKNETNGISIQKSPKVLLNETEYIQLHFIPVYLKRQTIEFASKIINKNEHDYKTIHQWYYENYKMTYNTLVVDKKYRKILAREDK